jgi:hypothetical protein
VIGGLCRFFAAPSTPARPRPASLPPTSAPASPPTTTTPPAPC